MARADAEWIAHGRTALPAATAALRAVLDLHAPEKVYQMKDGTWIHHCLGCQTISTHTEWPCPTVQAINEAVGISDKSSATRE